MAIRDATVVVVVVVVVVIAFTIRAFVVGRDRTRKAIKKKRTMALLLSIGVCEMQPI
jgi:uncharacterized membrane protein affecting hemolysin expression